MNPLLTTVLLACLLMGCAEQSSVEGGQDLDPSFFNLVEFVEAEAAQLAGTSISKTVVVNTTTEQQDVTEVNWAEELAPFTQSNLDRPALWDSYRVDTLRDGDEQGVRYLALDSALFTKQVEVWYADAGQPMKSVTRLRIRNSFDSFIATTEQRLTYRPGRYTVDSRQEANLLDARSLQIEVDWSVPGR